MIKFDATAYAATLTDAVTGWKTADNRSGVVARHALAALVSSALSPLAVAMTFYDAVLPTGANGKAVAPKEADDGTLRVRNLEQAHVNGSGGARKCLETVLYINANRAVSDDVVKAVEGFIIGGRSAMKLNPLAKFIRTEKAKLAKEETEAAGVTVEAPEPEAETVATVGDTLTAMLETLRGIAGLSDNIELVALQAIGVEIDRLAATVEAAEPLAEAA